MTTHPCQTYISIEARFLRAVLADDFSGLTNSEISEAKNIINGYKKEFEIFEPRGVATNNYEETMRLCKHKSTQHFSVLVKFKSDKTFDKECIARKAIKDAEEAENLKNDLTEEEAQAQFERDGF